MRRFSVALCLALLTLGSAWAETGTRVGAFNVVSEPDHFGGHDTVIAVADNGSTGLVIRCLQSGIALAYADVSNATGQWRPGFEGHASIRVDDQPVVESHVAAISGRLIEFDGAKAVIRSMAGAREIALRVSINRVTFDQSFTIDGSDRVVPMVLRACGVQGASAVGPGAAAPQPAATLGAGPVVHDQLDDADRVAVDSILGAYVASGRCKFSVNARTLDRLLAGRLRAGSLYGHKTLVEVLTMLVVAQTRADADGADTETACARARLDFGPGSADATAVGTGG